VSVKRLFVAVEDFFCIHFGWCAVRFLCRFRRFEEWYFETQVRSGDPS